MKDFHYYLCRQLKGGGMEIFMKHEDEFEKAIGDRKLFIMYEELLADYMDMEHEMAVSVYLLGAEDREKMLR